MCVYVITDTHMHLFKGMLGCLASIGLLQRVTGEHFNSLPDFFAPKPGVSITASQVLCFLILCV